MELSDQELESRLRRLALVEGGFLAVLMSHLAEFDRRRLAGEFGHPSLFHYCVRVLGFSEAAAYKRIQAARAVRDFPELLVELSSGRLNLAAVVAISPHLSHENIAELVSTARGKTIRELESFLAALAPRADSPDMLRALPLRAKGIRAAHPSRHPEPISEDRYVFRFTGARTVREKYERARALLLGRPAGACMETIFDAALEALLERVDPERRLNRKAERIAPARGKEVSTEAAQPAGAPERSRRIPQAIKDAVWRRDGGRCTFIGPDGQRCPEAARLEYDHIVPWGKGGGSDLASNIRLMCRTHNQLHARRAFGSALIDAAIMRRSPA